MSEACKIKLFLLGDSSVGKTTLIYKFVKDTFRNVYLPTIGFDHAIKEIILDNGKKLKIYFHDTAGQEKYRSIAFNLIKSAEGIILMYDITKKETFNAIPEWVKNIRDHKGKDFPIVLIANKCDLKEEREVEAEEGQKEAEKNGFLFYEMSCKDGINVQESILKLVSVILERNKKKEKNEKEGEKKEESIKLKIENKPKKKKKKFKC